MVVTSGVTANSTRDSVAVRTIMEHLFYVTLLATSLLAFSAVVRGENRCAKLMTCQPDTAALQKALGDSKFKEACKILKSALTCMDTAFKECKATGILPQETIDGYERTMKMGRDQMKQFCPSDNGGDKEEGGDKGGDSEAGKGSNSTPARFGTFSLTMLVVTIGAAIL